MYENPLTAGAREVLLAYLSKHAPDDSLLEAVLTTMHWQERIKSDLAEARKLLPKTAPTAAGAAITMQPATQPTDTKKSVPESNVIVQNIIEPPGEAAARVGANARMGILRYLHSRSASAADINQYLNGVQLNTNRLLKRLWQTGALGYDGEKFWSK